MRAEALEERIIEMPAEWGGIVPTEVFIQEGRRLAEEATRRGILLRLLGGVAIRIHCMEFLDFAEEIDALGRRSARVHGLGLHVSVEVSQE